MFRREVSKRVRFLQKSQMLGLVSAGNGKEGEGTKICCTGHRQQRPRRRGSSPPKLHEFSFCTVGPESATNYREMMSDRACVLVAALSETQGVPRRCADVIREHFDVATMEEFLKNKEQLENKIKAIFMWEFFPVVDEKLLRSLPALKVIVNNGVGVDHYDLPLIFSFGVKLANTPSVVDAATADMGMALLLASARNVLEGHRIATLPNITVFPINVNGMEVTGATLGIIGMGRIGYKVAQRARGFDMKILYHNRNRRAEEEEKLVGARYCVKIGDLLQESDFVMVVVNLTPQTRKLIGEKELCQMKPSATLINISRGAVIDQDALVQVLQKRRIRAAALDVTDPEPLPRDHSLLHLPNVTLTPHFGTATDQTTLKMVDVMIVNALAAIHGRPVPNEVLLP